MKKEIFWQDPERLTSGLVQEIKESKTMENVFDIKKYDGGSAEVPSYELLTIYDLEVFPISKEEIGTDTDWDQLFYQKKFINDIVATFKYKTKYGDIFKIDIRNTGEQRIFLDGELIINDPDKLLKNKNNIDENDTCWLVAEYYYLNNNGQYTSVSNSYDIYGTVYGSISEVLDSIADEDF
jgi:hypothetical protein